MISVVLGGSSIMHQIGVLEKSSHPLILQAINIYGDFRPLSDNLEGTKPWLLEYIGVKYTGNIITSTKKMGCIPK